MTSRRRILDNENGGLNIDAKFPAMIAGSGAMEMAESDDRLCRFVALPSLSGGEALHIAMSMMPLVVK